MSAAATASSPASAGDLEAGRRRDAARLGAAQAVNSYSGLASAHASEKTSAGTERSKATTPLEAEGGDPVRALRRSLAGI